MNSGSIDRYDADIADGSQSVCPFQVLRFSQGAKTMTSILTNNAALSALSILRSIDSNMESTQEHISSGLRVGSAADNAAYWSIASTMKSDKAALDTVGDALGLAQAKVDTNYQGLDVIKDLIGQIKNKLLTAAEPGNEKTKINAEITQLKNQILTVAQSSSFSGENWLYNTSTAALGNKSMVGSFTRASDGTVSVQTIDFDASASVIIDKNTASRGMLTKGYAQAVAGTTTSFAMFVLPGTANTATNVVEIKLDSTTSAETLSAMQSAVEAMLKDVTSAASTLGATKSRLDQQSSFVKSLSETFAKGVGRLVDADMNEESTKLKALQTQQQLGIQALSIANSAAQNIMSLFR